TKMLNYIHGTLPNKENEFGFAFSGGIDSVVFTNYLLKTGRQFKLYFFHHGDEDDNRALAFTKQYAKENNLEVVTNQNVVYHGSSDEVMRN
uniref:ATP-binding protein n=1 Tax=Enterobacter sp. JH23 TaxID=2923087 RepID=UPI00208E2EA7